MSISYTDEIDFETADFDFALFEQIANETPFYYKHTRHIENERGCIYDWTNIKLRYHGQMTEAIDKVFELFPKPYYVTSGNDHTDEKQIYAVEKNDEVTFYPRKDDDK